MQKVIPDASQEGEYNINDIFMGIPCVVGKGGIEKIITAPLSDDEQNALRKSAQTLREVLQSIKT